MKIYSWVFFGFVIALAAPVGLVLALDKPNVVVASERPIDAVQDTIDKAVKAVAEFPGEANLEPRRAKLREIIEPRFDFREMSKRSLGPTWNSVTPAEQEEFVKVFSELLAKTYLARIEFIEPNTVKIESEQVTEPKALVKTMIHHKGDVFPLDYKLVNVDKVWRVYDVVIENIGLVANYRNEFAGIIRKEEFSGLMKRLKEKSGLNS